MWFYTHFLQPAKLLSISLQKCEQMVGPLFSKTIYRWKCELVDEQFEYHICFYVPPRHSGCSRDCSLRIQNPKTMFGEKSNVVRHNFEMGGGLGEGERPMISFLGGGRRERSRPAKPL